MEELLPIIVAIVVFIISAVSKNKRKHKTDSGPAGSGSPWDDLLRGDWEKPHADVREADTAHGETTTVHVNQAVPESYTARSYVPDSSIPESYVPESMETIPVWENLENNVPAWESVESDAIPAAMQGGLSESDTAAVQPVPQRYAYVREGEYMGMEIRTGASARDMGMNEGMTGDRIKAGHAKNTLKKHTEKNRPAEDVIDGTLPETKKPRGIFENNEFDAKMAVIYSEIMNPKYNDF